MGIKFYKWLLNVFGYTYIWIEKKIEYPDDDVILGQKIDNMLYKMNRKQLCKYMDRSIGIKGFYDLQSTSKIRLGCQLLRNFTKLKLRRDRYNNSDLSTRTMNKLKQLISTEPVNDRLFAKKARIILKNHINEEIQK